MSPKIPERMNAVEIARPGGPEVLLPVERPVPVPGPEEVLVKVAAAGVNGPDLMQRKGLYPAPAGASDLPGLEVAGEIVALGRGVTRWKIGDPVAALANGGGYAEYCAVDARLCLPVPKGVALRDAGGLPETFFTVWSNVFMGAGLAELDRRRADAARAARLSARKSSRPTAPRSDAQSAATSAPTG